MKARLINEIGTRAFLRVFWHGCPNSEKGYHSAMVPVAVSPKINDGQVGGLPGKYPAHMWPKTCDRCGEAVPENATRQVYRERYFDCPGGRPQPGDLYVVELHKPDFPCPSGWENCDGKHLIAVLPNGFLWDIDGRGDNCPKPEEGTHRCWVRHGDPPNITVDKNGDTCDAGCGSVLAGDWHGFLTNGIFEAR